MVKAIPFVDKLLKEDFVYADGTPLLKVFEVAKRVSFILDDDVEVEPLVYNKTTAKPVIRLSIPYGPQEYDKYSIEFNLNTKIFYFDDIDNIHSNAKGYAKIGKVMAFFESIEIQTKDVLGK